MQENDNRDNESQERGLIGGGAKFELDLDDPLEADTLDFLQLPEFGANHYSLSDAALLIAIDQQAGDDLSAVDEPEFRKRIGSEQEKYLAALRTWVASGALEVIILGRDLTDASPLPERTYVSLSALDRWLDQSMLHRGSYLNSILEDSHRNESEAAWDAARAAAAERLTFRHPAPQHDDQEPALIGADSEQFYHAYMAKSEDLRVAKARIRHLEHVQFTRSGAPGRIGSDTKRRSSMYKILLALCSLAGIGPTDRQTAGVVERKLEELGLHLDDDTIRRHLREAAEIEPENLAAPRRKPN
ncbi:MAG: hypothetical protein QM766_27515 [Burkholderiaceae bacterium]